MPRLRSRTAQKRPLDLTAMCRFELISGQNIHGGAQHRTYLRELWKVYGEQITAEWTEKNPGSMPFAYWEWSPEVPPHLRATEAERWREMGDAWGELQRRRDEWLAGR